MMDGHSEDDVNGQGRVGDGPDRLLVVGQQVFGQTVLVLVAPTWKQMTVRFAVFAAFKKAEVVDTLYLKKIHASSKVYLLNWL